MVYLLDSHEEFLRSDWLEPQRLNFFVVFSAIKTKFHDKIWKVHQYSNCTLYVCFSVSIISNRVQIPIWFRTRVVMKNSFSDMREICTFPTLNYIISLCEFYYTLRFTSRLLQVWQVSALVLSSYTSPIQKQNIMFKELWLIQRGTLYTVKKVNDFPVPSRGCHLSNSPWTGVNKLFVQCISITHVASSPIMLNQP
jgi:hypothetical protein